MRLPRLASRFVKAIVAFVIAGAVGTAPLWGGGKIAGYQSILDAFPKELRDVIPWVSMLMTLTAVGVQFASRERLRQGWRRHLFAMTYVAVIVLVIASYSVYRAFVVSIEVPGAGTRVAYLVGSTLSPNCECAKRGLDIRECIGTEISVDPDEVAACFPREQISTRASILSGLYMLLMLAVATLIGLFVLQGVKLPRRKSK